MLNDPAWEAQVDQALADYLHLIEAAAVATDAAGSDKPSAAAELLTVLADYGRNYDMIVVAKVPLDEPFLIKYSERRALAWRGNRTQQDLIISDALSNHVVLSVDDPNVRITRPRATAASGDSDAFGTFTHRRGGQTYAIYAHGEDREYRAGLQFHVAPLLRLQFVIYVVAAVLVLLALAVVHEAPRRLQDLALIIGPSALAASVLLNREPSTLGSHLRRRSTIVLAGALLLLLAAGTASYLGLPVRSLLTDAARATWAGLAAAVSAVTGTFR